MTDWILVKLKQSARVNHLSAPTGNFEVSYIHLLRAFVDFQLNYYQIHELIMVDVDNQIEQLHKTN